ncbi:uncharacterized protein LOC132716562 [Ruditapes philippinarum]|uniref:uncharacterized protein LOC132716562 n=1 Tax=Ruditapes philippinarum TaxID=129788 RepID=UPI00295A7135|nr:uncharacterized protein LOC132716562 [Ruditapes philippinarum]
MNDINMDKFILCWFLWICPVFASNVDTLVPDSLANENACECGRDLTLSCKFKKKTFAIAWKNPHETVQIAKCLRNGTECDINPKYIDQYNISYDETNHIFSLTIIKVTMKDDGRKLVCSDGTNTDSKIIRVKDYEPLLFENTTAGTIQAISGCISNVTKAHNKREKEITPKIRNASITSCSKDSDCGNDLQVQYSEVISAKANDNGNCYLKVIADYGDEQKESYYTVGRYIVDDRDEERSNAVNLVVVVLVVFALIIAAAVYLIYLHHKEKLINNCIWSTSITNDKGNSDGRRFSQTKNETFKQSQRESCQTYAEQSEELNSNNEDTQSCNAIKEEGITQRLRYNGITSALDSNLDLPKHNEEEVSSEANDMPVNNHSVGQAEIEEENNLLSKGQTIIDLDTDSDEN